MNGNFKTKIIKTFLKNQFVVTEDLLEEIDEGFDVEYFLNKLKKHPENEEVVVLNKDIIRIITEDRKNLNLGEVEKLKAFKRDAILDFEETAEETKEDKKENLSGVKLIYCHEENAKKRTVEDFVAHFNKRFEEIRKFLLNRSELPNLLPANKIAAKKDRETVSIIGLIGEKIITKNGNLLLRIEDQGGEIMILVNKTKKELFESAKSLVADDIIGVSGTNSKDYLFANTILLPDVPFNKELTKSPLEEYAIFLSDIHIGSKYFLPEQFNKFIKWIKGEMGSEEQKALVSKIKYMFIIGDLVDGVGVYPEQEKELEITDIKQQYGLLAEHLRQIPSSLSIIVCPGNHDAVSLSEPQPILPKDISASIYDIPNLIVVSNPALVNIGTTNGFSGFDVLMYHGYSFDYYISNVDEIRNNGGYDRADLVMKYLLQRRHLAPTHSSTLYVPINTEDPLVIKKVPDFFVTGHIHKTSVANYQNITLICGSCWQSTTTFQEKVGHHPEPARVPLVNLQTREVKILRF